MLNVTAQLLVFIINFYFQDRSEAERVSIYFLGFVCPKCDSLELCVIQCLAFSMIFSRLEISPREIPAILTLRLTASTNLTSAE